MRRYKYILLSVALLASACSQEDNSSASLPKQGWGEVAFTTRVSDEVQDDAPAKPTFDIPAELIPSSDEMKLHITGEYIDNKTGVTAQYDQEFDNISEFSLSPSLWSGTYSASLSCGKDRTIESETNACFGSPIYDDIVVVADEEVGVDMSVALVNSIIRLQLTQEEDYFADYFRAAEFTIVTGAGAEFTFDPFSADNADRIVFVEAGTTLKLKGTAQRVNGSDITFAESEIGTAIAGYMNTIVIDAKDVGGLSLTIILNEGVVEVHEESFDINPLS